MGSDASEDGGAITQNSLEVRHIEMALDKDLLMKKVRFAEFAKSCERLCGDQIDLSAFRNFLNIKIFVLPNFTEIFTIYNRVLEK